MRRVRDEAYVATVTDDATPRVLCMACSCGHDGKLRVVTGGFELKLWQQLDAEKTSR